MFVLALSIAFGLSSCSDEARFKVNFIVDGEIYDSVATSGKEIISIPETPTKDGYDFGGWYWDDVTFEEKFSANSLANASLTSDVSVYAKWLCAHTPVIDALIPL